MNRATTGLDHKVLLEGRITLHRVLLAFDEILAQVNGEVDHIFAELVSFRGTKDKDKPVTLSIFAGS